MSSWAGALPIAKADPPQQVMSLCFSKIMFERGEEGSLYVRALFFLKVF